tara:strand:- start:8200 stop:8793 length:594 start_codon:yes stop_codon:yes gene_type:complete
MRQQTRLALRTSAAAHFAKYGFEGAAVDQISEDAGYSRGAFYSNFADKEAIFLELLVEHLERDITRFQRASDESATLEELVNRLAAAYRDLGENPDWCLLSAEFQLHATRSGVSGSLFSDAYSDYRNQVSALLETAFARFDFQSELDARELTSALIGLSHGLALERAATGASLPMEVTGKAIRALIFGAAVKSSVDP